MNINNLTLPKPPFEPVDTTELFRGKRVILFGLPGAFTPTCSTKQLPGYESMFEMFRSKGIDEIHCTSVNDNFVMMKWFKSQDIKNVQYIADGSGILANRLGMLVKKDNLGFGVRSWRYSAVINNGVVEQMFAEDGKCDDHDEDPYDISSPENIYEKL
jgi:peroxiredoxin